MKQILIFILIASSFFSCKNATSSADSAEEEVAIRATRQLSNRAIADHDTLSLILAWTPDYHMITSRNAEVSGAANAVHKFADEFKARPDVVYLRTPDKIEVFNKWSMASEQGRWTGQWTDGKEEIKVAGTYFAKWHRLKNKWLIRAEVFVPLTCEGGKFCEQSPL